MRFFDVHCHLGDEKIYKDIEGIVSRARTNGVDKFLTMGGGKNDWDRLVNIADTYKDVYVAFGWHPEDIKKVEELSELRKKLEHKKAVAIGETGLDFYWDREKKTKEIQITMLEKQILLAVEIQKPIIIHCREAEAEMLATLKQFSGFRAHFHCFGESDKLLKKVIDGGHMVSFGGNVTFKSAQRLRDLVKKVPLSQLLLETDSPYLSPEPVRGKLNEPSNLTHTAQFIAKELKIGLEELSNTTYENSLCFFGLEN